MGKPLGKDMLERSGKMQTYTNNHKYTLGNLMVKEVVPSSEMVLVWPNDLPYPPCLDEDLTNEHVRIQASNSDLGVWSQGEKIG
jgi:hypothetical protein